MSEMVDRDRLVQEEGYLRSQLFDLEYLITRLKRLLQEKEEALDMIKNSNKYLEEEMSNMDRHVSSLADNFTKTRFAKRILHDMQDSRRYNDRKLLDTYEEASRQCQKSILEDEDKLMNYRCQWSALKESLSKLLNLL